MFGTAVDGELVKILRLSKAEHIVVGWRIDEGTDPMAVSRPTN